VSFESPSSVVGFRGRAERSVSDAQLQANLTRATAHANYARGKAVAERDGWNALRERGREIRAESVTALPYLLESLEARLEENGVVVHWARDAVEARAIILAVLSGVGAKRVVKGKSMTTEEIGLNQVLAQAGVKGMETDLGERIVQLNEEPPSHVTAPALHLNREEIAEILSDSYGTDPQEDVESMVSRVRDGMRSEFVEAQAAIVGVNMAVADTGSLLLVGNEGNLRLSTSLPSTVIALMGIDKVIPGMSDAACILELLTRSATGQRITSYVTHLRGPRRSGEGPGPDALHVVLLDNGRSEMREDSLLWPALGCIRCGACMNVCPVYQHVGGHAYGWEIPGPIGSVLAAGMLGASHGGELADASTLCGACTEVCPVGIPLHEMLLEVRHRRVKEGQGRHGRLFRYWSGYFGGVGFLGWFTRMLRRTLSVPFFSSFAARILHWSPGRSAPRLAAKPVNQGKPKRGRKV